MSIGPKHRPAPLGETALRQLIGRALAKGYYRESFHAEHEHPERGISADDVFHGLERKDWALVDSPNYDDEHNNWEYLIRTQDLDGNELYIKIAVYPQENRFEVITRW
jgi:hypothetical protein